MNALPLGVCIQATAGAVTELTRNEMTSMG